MNCDLSVVVVNYNSHHWLQACLAGVERWCKGVDYETIVVDNASSDGSLHALSGRFPQVRLVRNARNLGFARAANQGIRAAAGRYVLLLNPDAVLLNGGVADWLAHLDAQPRIGISGPKVFDDESRTRVQMSCRAFPSAWNFLFSRHSPLTRLFPNNRFSRKFLLADFDRDRAGEVDWVSGCCMLLRRALLEEVGLLDEGYPLFFEDVDLCLRARRAGWGVLYDPALEVAHAVGETRSKAPYRSLLERHLSLWRFTRKYYRWRGLSGAVGLAIACRAAFLLALAFLKRTGPVWADTLLIQLGMVLAYAARSWWAFPWFERAIASYASVALGYTAMQLALLYLFDLYRLGRSRYEDYLDVLPRVIKAVSLGSLLLVCIAFFTRQFVLPRSIIVLSWALNILLLAGWRWFRLYAVQRRRATKRALIYGTGSLAALVEEQLLRKGALRLQPVGFVAPEAGGEVAVDPQRIVGTLAELDELVRTRKIGELIFAPETRSDEALGQVLRACRSIQVNTRVAPELFEIAMGAAHMSHLYLPYADLGGMARSDAAYLPFKRLLDVLAAALLLALLALPMAGIALAIKCRDGGGVLFRQPRVGFGEREFTLYKFRTMRDSRGAEADEDVARMTPLGRGLRLTRLDELPQLINVLRGEMSLVGPRAEWVPLARRMEREIPFFSLRHALRPGMTGWAQVEYKYTTSVEEYRRKLQYDLYYVKHVSLALDLKILLKTVWVVITGRGAR